LQGLEKVLNFYSQENYIYKTGSRLGNDRAMLTNAGRFIDRNPGIIPVRKFQESMLNSLTTMANFAKETTMSSPYRSQNPAKSFDLPHIDTHWNMDVLLKH